MVVVLLVRFVSIHQDVNCLDIRMHNPFLVQCSNASERVPDGSLHQGKRDVFLGMRLQVPYSEQKDTECKSRQALSPYHS